MPTPIEDIVSLASGLDDDAIDELARRLKQRKRDDRAITLAHENTTYRLARFPDDQIYNVMTNGLPIEFDECRVDRALRQGRGFGLGQVYAALVQLSGEGTRCLDDYKQAFAFPFLLDVVKPEKTFPYVFEIMNYKAWIEFRLRRSVPKGDPRLRDHRYVGPFEEEFGAEEIHCFIVMFWDHLRAHWQSARTSWATPFVFSVSSGPVAFGYANGRFFERSFRDVEDEEAQDRFVARVEKLVKAQSVRLTS